MNHSDAVPSYLDPETLSRVARLDLVARLVVEGLSRVYTGVPTTVSPWNFPNIEPICRVTHCAISTGRPMPSRTGCVKQYEEETNLKAYILCDVSGSMDFCAGAPMSKYRYATCLSAALAYLMLRQRDAVGLMLSATRSSPTCLRVRCRATCRRCSKRLIASSRRHPYGSGLSRSG